MANGDTRQEAESERTCQRGGRGTPERGTEDERTPILFQETHFLKMAGNINSIPLTSAAGLLGPKGVVKVCGSREPKLGYTHPADLLTLDTPSQSILSRTEGGHHRKTATEGRSSGMPKNPLILGKK